jgi:fructokinase
MYKIAAIGEILWDNFPEGRELGGAPTNFAVLSKYLGNESWVISAVGNDEPGKQIQKQLTQWGIHTELLQVSDQFKTGEVNIEVDEHGNPRYQIVENRACDHIQYIKEMENYLHFFDAISYGSLSHRSEDSRQTIFKFLHKLSGNCLKICDLNLRKNYYNVELIHSLLQISDVFKINKNEQKIIQSLLQAKTDTPETQLAFIKKWGLKALIVTNGDIDSEICMANDYSRLRSKKTSVVDTVGAGDSFLAAFANGYLRGQNLIDIHKNAIELSAKVCSVKGALGIFQ